MSLEHTFLSFSKVTVHGLYFNSIRCQYAISHKAGGRGGGGGVRGAQKEGACAPLEPLRKKNVHLSSHPFPLFSGNILL